MEHTKAYQEFKKNGNTKFVRYSEGAEMYHMSVSKFMQLEIKNIAVDPQNQGQGYGKALIDFLVSKYADEYSILQVGTGDSPLTVPFYEKCGFVRSHNIPNFFTDNYDHPIYECGVQLIDMVYLQRCL